METNWWLIISGLVTITIVAYLYATIHQVYKPYLWVIETNMPNTKNYVWEPGLHILPLPVGSLMFIKEKVFCGDRIFLMTIGRNDGNPGGDTLVEFADTQAIVIAQVIVCVKDPVKFTYASEEPIKASTTMIEGEFRMRFSSLSLQDAMGEECKNRITDQVVSDLNKAIDRWGIELISSDGKGGLSILDFELSEKDKESRSGILEAELNLKKAGINAQTIVINKKAEGQSEAEKLTVMADLLEMPVAEVVNYAVTMGLIDAIKGSSLILSSSGIAGLSAELASVMEKIREAASKK